eukprot:1543801-Lingulodinium_polyedra.AAC.1
MNCARPTPASSTACPTKTWQHNKLSNCNLSSTLAPGAPARWPSAHPAGALTPRCRKKTPPPRNLNNALAPP